MSRHPVKGDEDILFTFKITSMDERTYVRSGAVVYLCFHRDKNTFSSKASKLCFYLQAKYSIVMQFCGIKKLKILIHLCIYISISEVIRII